LGETAAWVLQTTTLSARGTHSVIYTDFVDDPKHPLALDVVQEWLDAAQGQVYQGMRKLLELDHEQEVLPLD
jgi:hypothetical protein